ncbi:MAG TPA: Bcr/CflA family drug resistance efflux transporter, partial [bacterium]
TAICAVMGCLLAVLMIIGVHTVWAIVLPMYGYAVGVGHVFPTASAGAIGPYPRTAGLASALLGFINLTGSAAYGVLAGVLFDGTPLPMSLAVAAAGVASIVVFVALSGLRDRAARAMGA